MELKHVQKELVVTDVVLLLIVPYGIETGVASPLNIPYPLF